MPALDDREVVYRDLHDVWNGFWELSEMRANSGFGLLPLAAESIRAYLELWVPDELRRQEWWVMVRAMDTTWMEHRAAQAPAEA